MTLYGSSIRVKSLQKLVDVARILKKRYAESYAKSPWFSNFREYLQYVDVESLAHEIGMSVRSTYDYVHALIAVLDVCQDVSGKDLSSQNVTDVGHDTSNDQDWDLEEDDDFDDLTDDDDFCLEDFESQSDSLQEPTGCDCSSSSSQNVTEEDLSGHIVTDVQEAEIL